MSRCCCVSAGRLDAVLQACPENLCFRPVLRPCPCSLSCKLAWHQCMCCALGWQVQARIRREDFVGFTAAPAATASATKAAASQVHLHLMQWQAVTSCSRSCRQSCKCVAEAARAQQTSCHQCAATPALRLCLSAAALPPEQQQSWQCLSSSAFIMQDISHWHRVLSPACVLTEQSPCCFLETVLTLLAGVSQQSYSSRRTWRSRRECSTGRRRPCSCRSRWQQQPAQLGDNRGSVGKLKACTTRRETSCCPPQRHGGQ
jgi:hypothetical protein